MSHYGVMKFPGFDITDKFPQPALIDTVFIVRENQTTIRLFNIYQSINFTTGDLRREQP
jgi:hypothetical protein